MSEPSAAASLSSVANDSGWPNSSLSARSVVAALPLPPPKPAAPLDRFVLTAFGQDKPGIVRRFSEYLAGKEINILDLFAHRQGADFLLIGQLEIPTNYNLAVLQADLERIAAELAFTVKLQHENIFVATNQLRFER